MSHKGSAAVRKGKAMGSQVSSEVRCAWCGTRKTATSEGWTDHKGRWACCGECVFREIKNEVSTDCEKCGAELGCHVCEGCETEI